MFVWAYHHLLKGALIMTVNLEKFFNADGESSEFDYGYDIGDAEFTSPVHVSGRIYNKTGIVNLDATAGFTLSASCALCAKDIAYSQEIPVRHIFVRGENSDTDDDLYIVVENMQLELNDLVSEDIYLSLPSRFLCKEDCKGLCPMCGQDLNVSSCGCVQPTDPTWDVLKNIF